tara:strand:- start:1435 stop:1896 length:462 start_codon:yes stop_codon:yes gene_type:complete
MSILHLLTPELDIDVKTIKINGSPIGSSGSLIQFVPTISSGTLDTFSNTRSYYSVNGNHLELYINCTITLVDANRSTVSIIIANPQARPFKAPAASEFVNGQFGGNSTQVGFTPKLATTGASNLVIEFKSTNLTIPLGTVFNVSFKSIVELAE